ncbi:MAG: VWA domain-containing protein [Shimia sp.]
MSVLPLPAARLVGLGAALRAGGFAASSDQATAYLAAVSALGPRDFGDLLRAARAIYGPAPERRAAFDALVESHFLDRTEVMQAADDDTEEAPPSEDGPTPDVQEADPSESPGQTASGLEVLGTRDLTPAARDAALRRFARLAPRRMPERLTRRTAPARGRVPDRARALRAAARTGGELLSLPTRARVTRLRPVLLLVDVSGSMKEQTEDLMRLAHAMTRLPTRVEVFTLGTTLTRVTPALRLRSEAQALARVAAMVPDFDGGTRLGETLGALLRVPRYAGFARGAVVVTASDGLEIGDPGALVAAAARLDRLAFAHLWMTPLASGPDFVPRTDALAAIAPHVDAFGPGADVAAICAHLLGEPSPREAR